MLPPPGPGPLPAGGRPIKIDEEEVKFQPITTVVFFGGKSYTVTFTPPDLKASGKGGSYTSETVKKIEELALEILSAQETGKPGSLKDTHTIKALFSEDESGSKTVDVMTKKTEKDSFVASDIKTDKLLEIASKISGVYHSALVSVSASFLSVKGTSPNIDNIALLDGEHYYKHEIESVIHDLLTHIDAADFEDVAGADHEAIKTALNSLGDPEIKYNSKGDRIIDLDRLITKITEEALPLSGGSSSSSAAPVPINYAPLIACIKIKCPSGQVYPPIDPATAPATIKGIANPRCNCFINAAITSFLANDQILTQVMSVLEASKDSKANPTIEGLASPLAPPALHADYKEWDIGLGGGTPKDLEAMNNTFLSMTIGDAATCARTLLTHWKSGNELDSKESQLLRMSLIKLFGKKPSQRVAIIPTIPSLPPPPRALPPPHMVIKIGAHTYEGAGIGINSSVSDDTDGFIRDLIQGLRVLREDALDLDSSKILLVEAPIALEDEIPGAHPKIRVLSAANLRDQTIRLIGALDDGDKPITIAFGVGSAVDQDTVNVMCIEDVFDEDSGYEIESFSVHSATLGHDWTYRKEADRWFRYDDYKDPKVFQVSDEEIEAVESGLMKATQVRRMVFKKSP
jgi:hypothetical protein